MNLDLPQVPRTDERLPLEIQLRELQTWAQQFRENMLEIVREFDTTFERRGEPPVMPHTTVAELVAGVKYRAGGSGEGRLVYAQDEAGGPVPAFSDGTVWRRCTDRAVVS